MRMEVRLVQKLIGDRRGATIVEFAFVAPVLFTVLLGLTDFGYRCYAAAIVEGTLQQAARLATVGDKTDADIDAFVKDKLNSFNSGATVTITKTNYYQFSNVKKAEKLTTDTNGNGIWDTGDCYQDLNNNGKWDTVAGRDGLGGSDDIVFYNVDFVFARVVPLSGFLGWSNTETITANTVMRNQPYGAQSIPVTKCTST
jgi:Flp pilus assembly protein TadG